MNFHNFSACVEFATNILVCNMFYSRLIVWSGDMAPLPGLEIKFYCTAKIVQQGGGGIYYVGMALNMNWTLKMPLVYLASWRWILIMNFYARYQFLSHFDVFFAYKSEFLFKGPDIPKHFCTHLMYGIKLTL